jgi:hypothetical protein
LTGRTFGQFSYILERSSGRDKAKCSYKPVGAFWQPPRDAGQGIMPSIVSRLYMGLQMAYMAF